MKYFLFESWHQWRVCLWAGVCKMSWGIMRITTCIIFGIISIFVYVYKEVAKFCQREFIASFIVGIIVILLCFGWFSTFINERAARVSAEMQRDSLSLKLDSAKQNSTATQNGND